MKKFLFAAFAVLFIASCSQAADLSFSTDSSGTITNMGGKLIPGFTVGYITNGTSQTAVARTSPNFKLGDLGVGVDINIPLGGASKPDGIDYLVLRYLEYSNSVWGARYGVLENVTLGSGLLVSNYSTNAKGGIIPTNNQKGIRGYYNFGTNGVEAMYTWSNIYAVRLTQKPFGNVTFGEYYITDTDGVNFKNPDGTTSVFPPVSGFGVDASYPLFPGANLFSEYAQIVNHGGGFSAGFSAGYDFIGLCKATLKAEKR